MGKRWERVQDPRSFSKSSLVWVIFALYTERAGRPYAIKVLSEWLKSWIVKLVTMPKPHVRKHAADSAVDENQIKE